MLPQRSLCITKGGPAKDVIIMNVIYDKRCGRNYKNILFIQNKPQSLNVHYVTILIVETGRYEVSSLLKSTEGSFR